MRVNEGRVDTILFEVKGVKEEVAREALRLGMNKLPLKAKIVAAEGGL